MPVLFCHCLPYAAASGRVWPGTHHGLWRWYPKVRANRFQHHHIICTACNRTIEFLSPELEALIRKVQQDHDFTPQQHAVRILSMCADCTQAAPRRSRHSTDLDAIMSRDALQVAIANEQRGLHFYSRALESTHDEATREVFVRLVEEESATWQRCRRSSRHYTRLTRRWTTNHPCSILTMTAWRIFFPKAS